MSDNPKAKLRELIHDIQTCMLTTVEADGTLCSRPMVNQEADGDERLWFFTRANSPKVHEVQTDDEHVNVSFAEPKEQKYVSISGTARLVLDQGKIKQLWKESLRTWFPDGVDDPQIALLCVTPTQAEYWDVPSSTMVHLFGYVKSAVTGQSPKPGDHEKVRL